MEVAGSSPNTIEKAWQQQLRGFVLAKPRQHVNKAPRTTDSAASGETLPASSSLGEFSADTAVANPPEFDSIYIKEGFGVGISGFAAM